MVEIPHRPASGTRRHQSGAPAALGFPTRGTCEKSPGFLRAGARRVELAPGRNSLRSHHAAAGVALGVLAALFAFRLELELCRS
jgi:hypothetical protein